MKTKKFPMRTVLVRAYCDCGGEIVATGAGVTFTATIGMAGAGAVIPHRCESCGKATTMCTSYPRVEHEEVKKRARKRPKKGAHRA